MGTRKIKGRQMLKAKDARLRRLLHWCGGLGDTLMTRLVLGLGVGWGGRGCWSGRDVGGGVRVRCGRRAGG